MSNFAWVTLATNDSYSLGALVVAHSLKKVATQHQLVVLVTPGVTESMRNKLKKVFDLVQFVDVLDSKDSANLAVLKRPELGITFTKLHCWTLTQFEKCVFLDADVLILQNCDELFEREELSAAPDVGWPDCFNSGVFVFKPSVDTYGKLIQFAESSGSFDGGDQGLLNQYFSDWATSDGSKRLPFLYNTASTATYSYLPAFKKFNKDIKILHFIGVTKPWTQHFDAISRHVQTPPGYGHIQEYLQLWWDLFVQNVHPTLSGEMSGVAGALATLTLGESSAEQIAYENQFRKANWEAGQIDYLGQDSFDNILKKIQQTIETPSAEVVEQRERRSKTPEVVPAPVPAAQPIAAAPVAPTPAPAAPVVEAPVVQEAAPVVAAPSPIVVQAPTAAATKEESPAPPKKKEDTPPPTEPTQEPEAEAKSESTAEPIVEPSIEQPIVEPIVESTAEPTPPIAEPIAEPTAEPTQEPTAE